MIARCYQPNWALVENSNLIKGVLSVIRFAATCFGLDGHISSKYFGCPLKAHRHWQMSKANLLLHLSQFESDEAVPYIHARAVLLLKTR